MYSERKMSVAGCCVRRMIWAPREASAEVTWAPMPDVPPYFFSRVIYQHCIEEELR